MALGAATEPESVLHHISTSGIRQKAQDEPGYHIKNGKNLSEG